MRRKTVLWMAISLVLLLGLAAAPTQAADLRGGDEIVIGRNEVIDDDLYLGAGTIIIDGTINGDLVAVGGRIVVNGTITGDVLAASQTIVVAGTVDDDLRIAGQALQIQPGAQIGDDVAAAGASLEMQPGSTVVGDLLFSGAQALLAGTIGQDVAGAMAALELRGVVDGNMDVVVGEPGQGPTVWMAQTDVAIPQLNAGLTLDDAAQVGGALRYTSNAEARISPQAQVAMGVTRLAAAEATSQAAPTAAARLWSLLRQFASLLLVGALLLWVAPGWTRRLADVASERPLQSMGWGAAATLLVVGLALALLILSAALAVGLGMLTLGGLAALVLALGIVGDVVLGAGYAIAGFVLAPIIVGFGAGRWLLGQVQPSWNERALAPLLTGLALLVALTALPWVGGLVRLAVILLGLGALWIWGQPLLRKRPGSPRFQVPLASAPTG
jgi:cytoskeletal protein CcmA (bactofilin family)